jgi:nucleotide-binding universal stress UspA family protein
VTYQVILVHVDDSPHLDERVRAAAEIAGTDASIYVLGMAMTGISRFIAGVDVSPSLAQECITNAVTDNDVHRRPASAMAKFEQAAHEAGLLGFEGRVVDNESLDGLSEQARYSDLVILTQPVPTESIVPMYDDLPEYVALASGRPVLVLPPANNHTVVGGDLLLAWDGSLEATRAVHHALPLLARAKSVRVLVIDTGRTQQSLHSGIAADIGWYLARHGIQAELLTERTRSEVGAALLAHCADLHIDLLVMGCYGHTHFREILLGGATLTVLQGMGCAVFMVH